LPLPSSPSPASLRSAYGGAVRRRSHLAAPRVAPPANPPARPLGHQNHSSLAVCARDTRPRHLSVRHAANGVAQPRHLAVALPGQASPRPLRPSSPSPSSLSYIRQCRPPNARPSLCPPRTPPPSPPTPTSSSSPGSHRSVPPMSNPSTPSPSSPPPAAHAPRHRHCPSTECLQTKLHGRRPHHGRLQPQLTVELPTPAIHAPS